MQKQNFNYDVAFSFLKQDEGLAQQLNNALKENTKTFIYTLRQDVVAGTDGEATFNRVFGKEARVVVVLYRKGWGKSSWTRIEETAIKNRALDEGYEFTLFIPLDQPPIIPDYLPRTYLWYGIHKFGIKVALSIIESKVQQLGGEVKAETPEGVAKRIKEAEEFNQKRIGFLNSMAGVERAGKEAKNLYELIKRKKESIEKEIHGFKIGCQEKDKAIMIHSYNYTLRFHWELSYSNSLDGSGLLVKVMKKKDLFNMSEEIIDEYNFNFDILPTQESIWVLDSDRKKHFTSEELIDYFFNILFKFIEAQEEEKRGSKYL